MQTRKALRRLGGAKSELGSGPLADYADQLVASMQKREADRMDDALRRAEQMGVGPHLTALKRLAAEYASQSLHDSKAPAIMAADFHDLLKTASKSQPTDNGLSRAATHAYMTWSKDPAGVLTLGDVAKFRDHYRQEYPRSSVGEVIESQMQRVGFNTLPVARLTRIAADIAREAEKTNDPQTAYEAGVVRYGLQGTRPEHIRARAFVRSLIESKSAQMAMESGDPDTEFASVDSPITGQPMMLELETAEQAESEGEEMPGAMDDIGLGDADDNEADDMYDLDDADLDGMDIMGQLDDMAGDSAAMDVPMGPEPSESIAVIKDPTDPDGGDLEVVLRPVEAEEPAVPAAENEGELAHAAANAPTSLSEALGVKPDYCPDHGEHCDGKHDDANKVAFAVYAYSAGKRADLPLDEFRSVGMAGALRRLASFGVRGEVRSRPETFARDAIIILDRTKGEYLHVTASEHGGDAAFEVEPQAQQDAAMPSVPADGAAALQLESMGKAKKASREQLRDIEGQLLSGKTIKQAGWSLSINDDAEVELTYEGRMARTASLRALDEVIDDFVARSEPLTVKTAASTEKRYTVSELFAVKCASCGSVDEYVAPDAAADLVCGSCSFETPAKRVAQLFSESNPVTGYIVVADVPEGEDPRDRNITARRIVSALQHVVADAHGTLRSDSKLEVVLPTSDPRRLNRARRVLEDRYGLKEFDITPVAAPTATTHTARFVVAFEGGEAPVEAADEATARRVFARFNPGVEVKSITAQMMGDEMPGMPEGGGEAAPLPVEQQLDAGPPADGAMMSGGTPHLSPPEQDALRAALTHYRNQGLGPMSALDQLGNQYSELIDKYGDKTDMQRHMIEAEAMRLAAEVWTKPAILSIEAQKVNMGESADDDASSMTPGGGIKSQHAPQGQFADGDMTGHGADDKDPGDFGADKPKAQHDAKDQKGTSLSSTDMGKDSDTGESKTTRSMDSVSKGAPKNVRSK